MALRQEMLNGLRDQIGVENFYDKPIEKVCKQKVMDDLQTLRKAKELISEYKALGVTLVTEDNVIKADYTRP